MKVSNKKGFTLAELLIVMAIVVVLAAVAIPTFSRQLETARETGDLETIRSAYTEAMSLAVLDARDGKIDGKIRYGSSAKGEKELPNDSSEGVFFLSSDNGWGSSDGSYVASLPNMDPPMAFSQSEQGKEWKYVSDYLFGVKLPSSATYDKNSIVFRFELGSSDGFLKLASSDLGLQNAETGGILFSSDLG